MFACRRLALKATRIGDCATPFSGLCPAFRRQLSTEAKQNEGDASTPGTATGSPENAAGGGDSDQLTKLQKEVKDLKDQLLRSYAEEENVRRIAKKDVESARQYANTSFAKAMLEISDNLERALEAIPKQLKEDLKAGKTDAMPAHLAKELVVGIEMTEKGLQKTFSSFGVIKYGAVGDAFDPALHDALYQGPNPSAPNNSISAVLKTGYKLKDRVIRAAQVGTVVNN